MFFPGGVSFGAARKKRRGPGCAGSATQRVKAAPDVHSSPKSRTLLAASIRVGYFVHEELAMRGSRYQELGNRAREMHGSMHRIERAMLLPTVNAVAIVECGVAGPWRLWRQDTRDLGGLAAARSLTWKAYAVRRGGSRAGVSHVGPRPIGGRFRDPRCAEGRAKRRFLKFFPCGWKIEVARGTTAARIPSRVRIAAAVAPAAA